MLEASSGPAVSPTITTPGLLSHKSIAARAKEWYLFPFAFVSRLVSFPELFKLPLHHFPHHIYNTNSIIHVSIKITQGMSTD